MPLIKMSTGWILALDILTWFLFNFFFSLYTVKRDMGSFHPGSFLYRTRKWEGAGKFYKKYLLVKKWKSLLPDGAKFWKNGFEKKFVGMKDPVYLEQFIKETCRAELTHWMLILISPLFFLWNPVNAGLLIVLYALASNLPCIIAQRYNRPRLIGLLIRW